MNEVVDVGGGRLIRGDCLAQVENIEAGSADLVLTDPPYGTVKGADIDGWDAGATDWDDALPPSELFRMSRRVLRKNGKAVLFAQEPYTSSLISTSDQPLPFIYRLIWRKDHFGNALNAKDAPVHKCEDVVVFRKRCGGWDYEHEHPLRDYASRIQSYIGLSLTEINNTLGHRRAEHFFYTDTMQFSLCTRETYRQLINTFDIDEMDGFREYDVLETADEEFTPAYKEKYPNVFNLPPDEKYKSDVLEYAKPHTGEHPTQKPVPLLEDLIRTFTHEGDLVVDFTAGSGSTAVAAQNTGRRFVAIEKDPDYFETAVGRVKGAEKRPSSGQQDLTAFSD